MSVVPAAGCASGFYGNDGDSVEVADPAGGAFFSGRDDLEGSVGGDRAAVLGIGDEDLSFMDGGIDFGQGVKNFITVGAFRDDSSHEEWAANTLALRYSKSGEESDERNSGVGFLGFGMRVEHGNSGMREGGELGGAEGERFALPCKGEAGGADCRSFVAHFLCGKSGSRGAGQKGEGEDRLHGNADKEGFHKTILVKFYRYKRAISDDFSVVRPQGRREQQSAVPFY